MLLFISITDQLDTLTDSSLYITLSSKFIQYNKHFTHFSPLTSGIRAPFRGLIPIPLIASRKRDEALRSEDSTIAISMAEEKSFLQPAVPKFDGHFDHWSMMMENLLRSKEYWSIIESGVPKITEAMSPEEIKKAEDAKLKDLKAKNYLFQAIDQGIMETILDKEIAKGIWDSMKQKYKGTTKVRQAQLQSLRREFELLGMKDDEYVSNYIARTLAIVNKMKSQVRKWIRKL